MKVKLNVLENGTEKIYTAEKGEILSNFLSIHNHNLDMPCAGKGICKKCKISVNGIEKLACQTIINRDMNIEIPDSLNFGNIVSGTDESIISETPLFSNFGVSVDIGTTTICASIFDKGGLISTVTRKNPQTRFGADVISRIEKSLSGEILEIAACIRNALSEIFIELSEKANISAELIDGAVITGNTAMLYLVTAQNPKPLSCAPFEVDRLFGEFIDSKELNFPISEKAKIYLPRCISAFVGADITCAILASGICDKSENSLLVDIGTNGEIALWHKNELLCASTAAGPAFEGSGITHGVYGVDGAIDKVWISGGKINYSTIGNKKAVGICGSGIIDALAVLLELEIIDETGAFTIDADYFEFENGIKITSSDVRKIQLAKGSVRAGIESLIEISGVKKSDIKNFYIAGGFGNYINLENASKIGLIPPELLNCAKTLGNSAYAGAAMILKDYSLIDKSEKTSSIAKTVAFDGNPIFMENYFNYMIFGDAN